MVLTRTLGTSAAVAEMSPLPEEGIPVPLLLFVQFTVAPGEETVNGMLIGSLPHTVKLGIGSRMGTGLIVMVKLIGWPVQMPAWGITVILAVCGLTTVAPVKDIFPTPLGANPIPGLSLVQLNVVPAEPVRLTVTN